MMFATLLFNEFMYTHAHCICIYFKSHTRTQCTWHDMCMRVLVGSSMFMTSQMTISIFFHRIFVRVFLCVPHFAIEHSTFLYYKYQWAILVCVCVCMREFMIGSTRQCIILVDRHFDFQLNHDDWCECFSYTKIIFVNCAHTYIHCRQPFLLVVFHKCII